MSSKESGLLNYDIYRITFLLAICMSAYVMWKFYVVGFIVLCGYALTIYIKDKCAEDIETDNRAVFITGCDTGMA
jgi:hypothetical protein